MDRSIIYNRNKLGILILVVILFIAGVFLLTRQKTVSTGAQFSLSPMDAVVRINGEEVEQDHQGKSRLTPGNYQVEISREFFESESQDIVVAEGQITEVLSLLEPSPGNSFAASLLREPEESANRENISYRLSLKREEDIRNKNPVVKLLPARTSEFRIDFSEPAADNTVTLLVTTDTVSQRAAALDWLRSKGYDPDELNIRYRFYDDL